ncbi:hypothetical protein NEF87_004162 [Candidatus Lokiarchaeum ossiferum]|uniref:C2H2-type domain-containing protein n=1 Tax=Candidatus Lokiarchaeum ossiferum TaxID=2951803 RepID=A0ABY6HYD3_9ARCH|nr:hypothetical protein NEF87_004162 [Candidatus Lokiarchaeum sp. B-35]
MAVEKEINITYFCELCKKEHTHKILHSNNPKFKKKPFPVVHIHKKDLSSEEICSIIYVDQNYKLKKVISKYKTEIIKNPLLNEIIKLEQEFKRLNQKYRDGISDLKSSITDLKKKNQ